MAFTRARVAVFIDGCFWHGCPAHMTWPRANAAWWRDKIEGNVRRDRDTDALLRARGWKVLRFWEHANSMRAAASICGTVRTRTELEDHGRRRR